MGKNGYFYLFFHQNPHLSYVWLFFLFFIPIKHMGMTWVFIGITWVYPCMLLWVLS